MDTKDTRFRLEPLPFTTARDVIGEWEMRWWEAVHTATVTADAEKEHGDIDDPADAVRIATQWCGQAFNAKVCGFFAFNLTGLRLALDRLVAEQYRRLEDEHEVLEGMVRGAMEDAVEGRSVRAEIAGLKAQADRIETLIHSLGQAST